MYDHILFPTDGSDGANAVFDHVLDLAASHDATLYVLHVADTMQYTATRVQGEVVDAFEQEGERIVDETAARASPRGVATVTDVVQGGVPETIAAYADEYEIDLVAMATRGRTGLGQRVLGSITERVVRRSAVPVLTLPPDADALRYPYQRVLVPTDGSASASAALERAADIAKTTDATVHVFSVVEDLTLGIDVRSGLQQDAFEEQAREVVTDAATAASDAGVEDVSEVVEHGSAVHRAIQSYLEDHEIDLVVMGTHGRTGADRYLLGSVAEKTIRTVDVPVLIVPSPELEE